VVQLSSETHKKPAWCGFFVACDLALLTHFNKNTINGLSFSRPLNAGARCSTGEPFSKAVSVRSTITQAGLGSALNFSSSWRPTNSGRSS